jgi:hypothetical protein
MIFCEKAGKIKHYPSYRALLGFITLAKHGGDGAYKVATY